MGELHPIKRETFDTQAQINIDPKGFTRKVDVYREENGCLYMLRGADHPQFGALESWLIPQLGLRASIFHFRPGFERPQDFYFDVVRINHQDHIWETADYYIDLISLTGSPVEVVDIDELAAATSAHLIEPGEAEQAIEATLQAVDGITRNGDDAMAWLAKLGFPLTWADHVELTPAAE